MTKKLSFIFVLIIIAFSVKAQEGDPIIPEEKEERPVILEDEMDSAYTQTPFGRLAEQANRMTAPENNSNLKFNSAFLPIENEGSDLAPKAEPKKLSYNFLYYLFYKFRKVDNADE